MCKCVTSFALLNSIKVFDPAKRFPSSESSFFQSNYLVVLLSFLFLFLFLLNLNYLPVPYNSDCFYDEAERSHPPDNEDDANKDASLNKPKISSLTTLSNLNFCELIFIPKP